MDGVDAVDRCAHLGWPYDVRCALCVVEFYDGMMAGHLGKFTNVAVSFLRPSHRVELRRERILPRLHIYLILSSHANWDMSNTARDEE